MAHNLVILGGNSHPQLVDYICNTLGVPQCQRILSSFSVGESRCEIRDSVRGKDVYIIQSGGGKVNDHFVDLCIMISACKTGSAKRVTAVLPLFPYSRQPDVPYNKAGAPLSKAPSELSRSDYSFESRPGTPSPGIPPTPGLSNGVDGLYKKLARSTLEEQQNISPTKHSVNGSSAPAMQREPSGYLTSQRSRGDSTTSVHESDYPGEGTTGLFKPKPGYKQWVAQAGTLVADLLTCAGADHIITMDLHDPQYQGFFDIPVDNLYGRPLLKRYIQLNIPNFKDAVIVSPDAGGAKRATAIADALNMDFALIHKVYISLIY